MLLRVPSTPTPGWRGRIFLDAGWILYLGPGSSADRHEHHAVQLVWSHEGPIQIGLDNVLQREAVLVPANTPHTLMAVDRTIVLLLVDPNGGRGVALERLACTEVGAELRAKLTEIAFPAPDLTPSEARSWCIDVLQSLGASGTQMELSSVSRRAIAYVERTIDGIPRVAEAAAAVRLSSTRLTHIFSDEVGIPFRRFVLWTRIKRAVDVFQAGNDLSTSAIAAGFSDAAHFSRTFRAMFGLSPSLVLPLAEISGTAWSPP
jgi:AraC-like DNA-binding protein